MTKLEMPKRERVGFGVPAPLKEKENGQVNVLDRQGTNTF
jgi:hypothetical protein